MKYKMMLLIERTVCATGRVRASAVWATDWIQTVGVIVVPSADFAYAVIQAESSSVSELLAVVTSNYFDLPFFDRMAEVVYDCTSCDETFDVF